MPDASEAATAGARPFGLLHLLLPPLWLGSVIGLWTSRGWFAHPGDGVAWLGAGARAGAVVAGAAATFLLAKALARREVGASVARDLPGVLACGLLALGAGTAVDAFHADLFWVASLFHDSLVLALSAWCFARHRRGRVAAARPARAGILAVNLVLTLVVAEAALTVYARLRPHPLLASGSDPVRRMEALRLAPGQPYLGFPANSGGYYDEEFVAGGPDTLVVAVLADSFGVGVVPYRFNFVTVAEEILAERLSERFERVALDNFAVSGVGMNEYAYLLDTEVMRWNPDRVVLGVFVGNDIHYDAPFGEAPRRDRRSLLRWTVWAVPRRLWRLATEAPPPLPEAAEDPARRGAPAPVRDPSQERPTYSRELFLSIEIRRMEVCNAGSPAIEAAYQALFRGLLHFRERLGDDLLVVVLPDEFQVNDSLYRELSRVRPDLSRLPRDLPQERIGAFCEREGIDCLDLLPALRAAEAQQRTYHRRDTHLNAHGNAVVGRALAEALLDRV